MSDNSNAEYVALQPIDHNGVRAYNPGDRVPADNVERHNYEKGVQVAEVDSKDAQAVTGGTTPAASASEPTPPASTPAKTGTGRAKP